MAMYAKEMGRISEEPYGAAAITPNALSSPYAQQFRP